jgi:hypothetical protein
VARDTLLPGESLSRGESLRSQNGYFELVHQQDGNLCLKYSGTSAETTWNSGTANRGGGPLVMQPDGNCCMYNNEGSPIWCTHTFPHSGSRMVMQSDGNLVVYNPADQAIWSSATMWDKKRWTATEEYRCSYADWESCSGVGRTEAEAIESCRIFQFGSCQLTGRVEDRKNLTTSFEDVEIGS